MKPFRYLSLLFFFLAGCVRPASGIPDPFPTLEPTATISPREVPFPFSQGSTWIYEYTAYDEGKSAAWLVTETITEFTEENGFLVSRVERSVELREGDSQGLFSIPNEGTFWYILHGSDLYIQHTALDLAALPETASHEVVFPLKGNFGCWYVNPFDIGPQPPMGESAPGCRHVSAEGVSYQTPGGVFQDCFELVTPYNNGAEIDLFCEQAGFVSGKFDHLGSPFGYSYRLVGYSLPEP
jgi:hypothetical protein